MKAPKGVKWGGSPIIGGKWVAPQVGCQPACFEGPTPLWDPPWSGAGGSSANPRLAVERFRKFEKNENADSPPETKLTYFMTWRAFLPKNQCHPKSQP